MSILGHFNYWVHEAGHLIFLPFANALHWHFLEAAAGTLLECLMPVIFMGAFLLKSDFFGIAFCFGWLSTCFFYASWYIGDAQLTNIVNHDWHYMLSVTGMLFYNRKIAFFVNCIGVVLMLTAIISGLWLLWQMFHLKKKAYKRLI